MNSEHETINKLYLKRHIDWDDIQASWDKNWDEDPVIVIFDIERNEATYLMMTQFFAGNPPIFSRGIMAFGSFSLIPIPDHIIEAGRGIHRRSSLTVYRIYYGLANEFSK